MELFGTNSNGKVYKQCINSTKCSKLHLNNLQKFQKFTFASISCFGDIKTERLASVNPDKSRHAFLNNREISDNLIQDFFL